MAARSTTSVRLRILGQFALSNSEREIVLSGVKSRALLAYLACTAGKPQSRDKLLGLLWGERFEEQARQSLRHALSELRKVVGVNGLQTGHGLVRLDPKFPSDVSQFETLLSAGGRNRLREAVALYQDDLLTGFSLREVPFMDWLAAERARLRALALNGLEKLLDATDQALTPAERLELAQRAVSLDPYRERAHREILHALARLGRRNDALVHYQQLEHTLKADLGVEPELTTREVVEGVRSGTTTPNAILSRASHAQAERVVRSNAKPRAPPEQRSFALLPFANLNGHPKWERLADGISGDIITDLARLNEFLVIARNSSFAYKTKAVDVRQVGKELGVRYVLEGSSAGQR